MSKPQILLADNSDSFSQTCAEYLELFGYQVQRVFTPEECSKALQKGLIHLAILDLRMRDDTDEKDVSGLMLAKQGNARIPKIILTAFPTWESVRESRSTVDHPLPPAVSYVDKAEGLEVLLQHVRSVFDQHVRINWDLEIDWKPGDRFSLGASIEPELENERVTQRADEVEDLFRRLFRSYDQIRVGELLWRREGRLALKAFAFAKDRMPESMILVCGRRTEMRDEHRRFHDHAPKASKVCFAALHLSAETTHFAANTYVFGGCDLETVRPLHELCRADAKAFAAAVTTLYGQTLAEWSQEKRRLEENRTLNELYRSAFGLDPAQPWQPARPGLPGLPGLIDQPALAAKIRELIRRLHTIGLRAELRGGELTLRFNDLSFSYPDPAPLVFKDTTIGQPVVLINTPGALSGDNILIDRNNQALLTDFAAAGPAPLLWNYVALEAAIRFDLVESNNLRRLHDLERRLVEQDFTGFDLRDFEPPLQKLLRAIQQVRLVAFNDTAQDLSPYHLAIFYHAASRLAHAPLTPHLTNSELARLAHLLISTAINAKFLLRAQSPVVHSLESGEPGIYLNPDNSEVRVDGRRVRLTPQELKLLSYLHSRANQVCTLREIIEQVLEYKYDESHEANVHTAINRLRKKIEPHPNSRRYVYNDRSLGYRLMLDPAT